MPSLYDPFLTPEERQDNQSISPRDLTSELNLLRVLTARYLAWLQAASDGNNTPEGGIVVTDSIMRSLARLIGQIALVLNAHIQLNPALASIAEEVEEGLNLTRLQFGLLDPEELLAEAAFSLPSGPSPP